MGSMVDGGGRSAERTSVNATSWTAWSDRRKVIEWFCEAWDAQKRRAFDMRIHPQTSGVRGRLKPGPEVVELPWSGRGQHRFTERAGLDPAAPCDL